MKHLLVHPSCYPDHKRQISVLVFGYALSKSVLSVDKVLIRLYFVVASSFDYFNTSADIISPLPKAALKETILFHRVTGEVP